MPDLAEARELFLVALGAWAKGRRKDLRLDVKSAPFWTPLELVCAVVPRLRRRRPVWQLLGSWDTAHAGRGKGRQGVGKGVRTNRALSRTTQKRRTQSLSWRASPSFVIVADVCAARAFVLCFVPRKRRSCLVLCNRQCASSLMTNMLRNGCGRRRRCHVHGKDSRAQGRRCDAAACRPAGVRAVRACGEGLCGLVGR